MLHNKVHNCQVGLSPCKKKKKLRPRRDEHRHHCRIYLRTTFRHANNLSMTALSVCHKTKYRLTQTAVIFFFLVTIHICGLFLLCWSWSIKESFWRKIYILWEKRQTRILCCDGRISLNKAVEMNLSFVGWKMERLKSWPSSCRSDANSFHPWWGRIGCYRSVKWSDGQMVCCQVEKRAVLILKCRSMGRMH